MAWAPDKLIRCAECDRLKLVPAPSERDVCCECLPTPEYPDMGPGPYGIDYWIVRDANPNLGR